MSLPDVMMYGNIPILQMRRVYVPFYCRPITGKTAHARLILFHLPEAYILTL